MLERLESEWQSNYLRVLMQAPLQVQVQGQQQHSRRMHTYTTQDHCLGIPMLPFETNHKIKVSKDEESKPVDSILIFSRGQTETHLITGPEDRIRLCTNFVEKIVSYPDHFAVQFSISKCTDRFAMVIQHGDYGSFRKAGCTVSMYSCYKCPR